MKPCYTWSITVHNYTSKKRGCVRLLALSQVTYRIAKNFRGRKLLQILQFWAIRKSFLCKIWGVASFGTAKASNPRKFSPRKAYFSPIRESFLPRKFPAIRYVERRSGIGCSQPPLTWHIWTWCLQRLYCASLNIKFSELSSNSTSVAVLGRNQTSFHFVFGYAFKELNSWWSSCVLCKCIKYSWVYAARANSGLRVMYYMHEICHWIMFYFCPRLPWLIHLQTISYCAVGKLYQTHDSVYIVSVTINGHSTTSALSSTLCTHYT